MITLIGIVVLVVVTILLTKQQRKRKKTTDTMITTSIQTPTDTPKVDIPSSPTTEITPQPIPVYHMFMGRTTPDATSAEHARDSYLTVRPYFITKQTLDGLVIGDILYDTYPNKPTNGNNKWIALKTLGSCAQCPSGVYALQIGNDGKILDIKFC